MDASARSDQMRKDRGIVTAARPDMQHHFTLRDRKRVKQVGVQTRLADVDAPR